MPYRRNSVIEKPVNVIKGIGRIFKGIVKAMPYSRK